MVYLNNIFDGSVTHIAAKLEKSSLFHHLLSYFALHKTAVQFIF